MKNGFMSILALSSIMGEKVRLGGFDHVEGGSIYKPQQPTAPHGRRLDDPWRREGRAYRRDPKTGLKLRVKP